MNPRNLKGKNLKYMIHAVCSSSFILFGYDQGLLGGIISTNQFLSAYHTSSTSILVSTNSAIYSVGALVGCLACAIYGNRWERKISLMLGCCCILIGGIIQASSPNLKVMIAGRISAGVGIGFNSSTVPIWIAEISPCKTRGRNIAIQVELLCIGLVCVYWMEYGLSFVSPPEEFSFRLPLAF